MGKLFLCFADRNRRFKGRCDGVGGRFRWRQKLELEINDTCVNVVSDLFCSILMSDGREI